MKSFEKIAILSIPILVLGFFIFFSSRRVENVRENPNPEEQTEETIMAEPFTSKLKNEVDFPLETKEEIPSLTTSVSAEGTGDRAVATGDNITVNYRGWTATDKNIFDQSFNRGDEGFTFDVGGRVIDGWNEGVVGMKQGEVRRLYIPSEMGYGEFGSGEAIPPNADLIFDVELISIN